MPWAKSSQCKGSPARRLAKKSVMSVGTKGMMTVRPAGRGRQEGSEMGVVCRCSRGGAARRERGPEASEMQRCSLHCDCNISSD